VNVGIALLGIVGGLVVAVGLGLQSRRDSALDHLLAADGAVADATVVAVVPMGRHLALRRVTFALDDESEFLQTFPFSEFGQLGLSEGSRVTVRILHDPTTSDLRGRLARPAVPTIGRGDTVPIVIGVFIAVLGLLASLVV
jgi:hypothetical protein